MTTRPAIPIAAAAALLSLLSCRDRTADAGGDRQRAAPEPTLLFSAIPDQDTTAQRERYRPVADYLARALGVKVGFVPADSYGASVEKFENGDIQLAWFGGVTGVQARQRVAGARALAAGASDLEFRSFFVANASTGLRESAEFPAELAGLSFTFGSPSSTSGCIMPSYFILLNSGKPPREFFAKQPLGFSGAHDKTALQVQDGTFEAGVLNFATYESLVESGTIDPARCVKIWVTPPYADYNFTAHPNLERTFGAGFLDRLQQALVACDDPAALKALDRERLVPVDNATFAGIAEVLEKVSFE